MAGAQTTSQSGADRWLRIAIRYRWFLIRNVALTLILVAAVVGLLPRQYTAETTLVPAQTLQQLTPDGQTATLEFSPFVRNTASDPLELIQEMAWGRSVLLPVLQLRVEKGGDSMHFYRYLGYDSPEEAYRHARDFLRIEPRRGGALRIAVTTHRPELSARVANEFAQQLDEVAREQRTSLARENRIYYENHLRRVEEELVQAGEQLARFQAEQGLFELEEQTRAILREAVNLRTEIERKRTQLRTLLRTMRPGNPAVERLSAEIEELQRTYRELFAELATGTAASPRAQDQLPALQMQWQSLLRRFESAQTLWGTLNDLYQRALLEEGRTTPVLQVLEKAVPPSRPSGPSLSRWLLVFGLLSFALSLVLARMLESRSPEGLPEGNGSLTLYAEQQLAQDLARARKVVLKLSKRTLRRHIDQETQ